MMSTKNIAAPGFRKGRACSYQPQEMIDAANRERNPEHRRPNKFSHMKKFITILFAAVLLAGCRSAYDVTLTNGMQFTGVSKPKLDKDKQMFVFKNMSGKTYTIPESRIRTIEPHEKAQSQFKGSSDAQKFNSSGR